MEYITIEGTQGICPTGWHLPTDFEWCTLEQVVDPTISCSYTGLRGVDGGGKMKTTGTIEDGSGLWYSPNTGATNSSGFSALPNGYSSFFLLGYANSFWSSSVYYPDAWIRGLGYDNAKVYRALRDKTYGLGVRCLRD